VGIRDLLPVRGPSTNGRSVVSAVPDLAKRIAPWAAQPRDLAPQLAQQAAPAPAPLARKAVVYSPDLFWLAGSPSDYRTDDLSLHGQQAYIVAALAYICIRYRATKLREAPLMVVEETTAGESWLKNHELNPLLARPNPDYGMARLVEATETYLCTTGRCLWVKNRDRAGRVASLYPFHGDEFQVEAADGRLYGRFSVDGRAIVGPEEVVYFAYFDPSNPQGGIAPLDAAMAHLNIAHTLQSRIRAFVRNAMSPGGVYVADKDWRPTADEFDQVKQELATLFQGANTGKPGVATGGGSFQKGWSLADMALGELWREAEAIVCACFGVPPSLVGTVVGLENSPWSHLKDAKRSFYDETILPEWTFLSDALTDGLLREGDENPAHLVRFDTSRIRALQVDLAQQALVASTAQQWTSVNERRAMMGLAPVADPKADEIPELTAPVMPPTPVGAGEQGDQGDAGKALRRGQPSVSVRFVQTDALLEQHGDVWELAAASLLQSDRDALAAVVVRAMSAKAASGAKETAPKKVPQRVLTAIEAHLDDESGPAWKAVARSLVQQTADAAMYATVVPDTGISYRLLRPHMGSYVEREAAFLVTSVTDTTKQAVRDALTEAYAAGDGPDAVARRIRELAAFDRPRAKLIARTETTRVFNGAPLESLTQYGQTTGSKFIKRWLATMDDRVRDEHAAMHGEEVPVDQPFSNGLQAPGEPNCRCGLTYGLAGADR
jgi:HK97 family phage portal protein